MKYKFGEKIRKIREKKKITIKQIAQKIGVTESLISQIERNKVSPAIDTLLKIVDHLDIDLEYLFSEFKKKQAVNLVRYEERKKMITPGTTYELLSKTTGDNEEHEIESYYMEIDPGGKSGSTEYGHRGKELGIIIEGTGEFKIGNTVYKLKPGDSLSFSSDVPHMLVNTGDDLLKAFWVITPPKKFIN